MLQKITNAVTNGMARVRWFTYRPGVPSGIGVGVGGLGLNKTQSDPINSPYDLRNTVRGDLAPLQGAHNQMYQSGPAVSIKGGGSGLTGAWALQQLAEFQAGSK